MEEVKIFKALSDDSRIKILMIISHKNICAKGIAKHLDISEAAVSQHIKILKEANLISGVKRGYRIVYMLNKETFNRISEFITKLCNERMRVSFVCNSNCNNKKCYNKYILREDLKMKICFPVKSNLGMESIPYGHFGTAPMFVVCDLEKGEVNTVDNGDLGHEHGHCQPMKALSGAEVDAVVVGGIGRGAILGLNERGIKVYKAIEGSIQENIEAYKNGELKEFSMNHTCNHDGCAHN
ncbi:metalloregulator ArsR/SmtB family transcription factor [uncultured Clostridium sp.]|uniref:metalloregulator ArsR/SmtB family transcription factor n=1 Tax=uncultured Clostridium sp. TaxID=59620 RepID=UPI0034521919